MAARARFGATVGASLEYELEKPKCSRMSRLANANDA
ncbi:MAG: hypothetical protein QOH65_2866 [Methylobacteriaceae bacterium]|jgi:hypothetical protein|nr:hypothetical protein [Methylobacteriaceae bacterium]